MTNNPSPAPPIVLGVDIGGSSIKAALADTDAGTLQSDIIVKDTPEPSGPSQVRAAIEEVVQETEWSGDIGIGYPGVVVDGVCRSAANVSKDWLEVNARELFADLTGGKLAVLNDADAAALAELAYGAGQEHNHDRGGVVLTLTLGTGIGSAFFYRGHLFPNTEFGHVQVDGMEAEHLAAASVRVAKNLSWEAWGNRVNRVLAEMEMLISPELIILGGGVTENWDQFKDYLTTRCDIRVAKTGNTAGLLGAALATRREI